MFDAVRVRRWLAIVGWATLVAMPAAADDPRGDERFGPFSAFVGHWQGSTVLPDGSAPGVVESTVSYTLGGSFLRIDTRIVFPPALATTHVDVRHETLMISFDSSSGGFVARGFYGEGYATRESVELDGATVILETSDIENGPEGMSTRQTWSVNEHGELERVFEIEMPGTGRRTYQTMTLKRVAAGG